MEKRKPSYDLAAIKAALNSPEALSMTATARRSALQLGFDAAGVVEVIHGLDRKMFQKSMTTYVDHRIWQDVYETRARNLVLYVKFQANVVMEFTVMSFKEK